jgi:flagellar biosynthesis protein FlhB
MADQAAEKTEQPTPRKLQRSKERGQVPRSQELGSVISIAALVVTIALLSSTLTDWFANLIKDGLTGPTDPFIGVQAFSTFMNGKLLNAMIAISPIIGALTVASIAGSIAVGGYTFSAESIKLKWDSLNPAKNMGNLFSISSIVKLIISIAKLILVSLVVWFYLKDKLETLAVLRWAWSAEILAGIAKIVFGVSIRICAILLAIALVDIFYQKWKFTKDLRMSHQEIRQEHKDVEGSPELKSRIRQMQVQIATRQLQSTVPKADVVLVNPTHYAVAIQYDNSSMEAPAVVAKGADQMANKIREIARAHGVPIVRRPELTRTLFATVDPGHPIPQDLYMAIAEVLAMLHRLRQQRKN